METFAEVKKRIRAGLTVGGVYPMIPVKAEYRRKKDFDTMEVKFLVQLGMRYSCTIYKTVFFRSAAQANKEINYLLKFICPDCLSTTITAPTFKEYVEQISLLINKELDMQGANKARSTIYGKVLIKNGSKYAELPDLLSQNGTEINYLATVDNLEKIYYFTEWEGANCKVPFEILPELQDSQAALHGTAQPGFSASAPVNGVNNSWDAEIKSDDLPF